MTPTSPWRALGHRNYAVFMLGQSVSLCGSWMQIVAQAWLVYRLTGSPLLLGFVEFLSRSPILVFGFIGGAVADRWPRRRVLLITNALLLLQAGALAGLTLTGRMTVEWILVLACVLGLISVVEIPTRHAFLADLVPRSAIASAIGLNSSTFNAARIIGPTVAGIVVATSGEGLCFLLNALTYLCILGCTWAIRLDPKPGSDPVNARRLLVEGFRYALDTPHVRAVLTLATALSLMALPVTTLLPVFAVEVLRGGPGSYGTLMATTGVGALVGALYIARRSGIEGLDQVIARSVACFGVGLLILAASATLWISVPARLLTGGGMVSSLAGINTLLQSLAPDGLRGRVISLYATVTIGMSVFGSLFAGTGATYLGAPGTVAIGGVMTLAAAMVFSSTLPSMRRHLRKHRVLPSEEVAAS